MNDCKFSGRPTRDPEIRYTEGTQPMAVARYTLAVDRKYKKEGGQQADFLSIVAFGKTAEFVEKYIKKGIKVIVECHAQSGSYTDKNGNKRTAAEVVCGRFEFIERREQSGSQGEPQGMESFGQQVPFNEEIPF